MEFLYSFLRLQVAGKPGMASQNVCCFLKLSRSVRNTKFRSDCRASNKYIPSQFFSFHLVTTFTLRNLTGQVTISTESCTLLRLTQCSEMTMDKSVKDKIHHRLTHLMLYASKHSPGRMLSTITFSLSNCQTFQQDSLSYRHFGNICTIMQLEPGGTRYNGLFVEDPPERGTLFFRFRVNQMVANSRVAVYEWVGKSFT